MLLRVNLPKTGRTASVLLAQRYRSVMAHRVGRLGSSAYDPTREHAGVVASVTQVAAPHPDPLVMPEACFQHDVKNGERENGALAKLPWEHLLRSN